MADILHVELVLEEAVQVVVGKSQSVVADRPHRLALGVGDSAISFAITLAVALGVKTAAA